MSDEDNAEGWSRLVRPEIGNMTRLVELWLRRLELSGAELTSAIEFAAALDSSPRTPAAHLSLAWHVIDDACVAGGTPHPEGLSTCRSNATSVAHACSLLVEEVAANVTRLDHPVLLCCTLGFSRSVFGRWGLLPSRGAILVDLHADGRGLPPATDLPTLTGVHWAASGSLTRALESESVLVPLDGASVLVPSPEAVAGVMARRVSRADPTDAVLFCAAARVAVESGEWEKVTKISRLLGEAEAPVRAAVALGIDRWLGLEVPLVKRAFLATASRFAKHANP